MQRTYPAGLCQIGFCVSGFMWDVIRWTSLQTCLRETVLCVPWNVTLRLWAAAAAAAAGASDVQCGAGGFRCDATVTPSAAKLQGDSHHNPFTLLWVMKTLLTTWINQSSALSMFSNLNIMCYLYGSWERDTRSAGGLHLYHLHFPIVTTFTQNDTWLRHLNPLTCWINLICKQWSIKLHHFNSHVSALCSVSSLSFIWISLCTQ